MKEEKIAQLLRKGSMPADLIHQGYARGTVYKVHKQLRGEGGTLSDPANVETVANHSLDDDPEILDLKKEVRKAQLEKELAEVKSQAKSEVHLTDLEARVSALEDDVLAIWKVVEDWIP